MESAVRAGGRGTLDTTDKNLSIKCYFFKILVSPLATPHRGHLNLIERFLSVISEDTGNRHSTGVQDGQ